MDSHLIILEPPAVRVVRFRDRSAASPDLPFASAVARLRERKHEPLFVAVFFIGLLALLGVLVGNASSPTACSGK